VEGAGTASGAAASDAGGNVGSGGAEGTGSTEVAIDPDGVCSPPCGVVLKEVPPVEVMTFPQGAFVATLFHDTATRAFELRAGTTSPEAGEILVMTFTWESNQYGYGEWVQNYWTFVSFEPDVDVGGYSRPEAVEFTAVVEDPTIDARVQVRFSYVNRSLLVHEAARLR
jgi:hypothetical protein